MATILNTRDIELQATSPRVAGVTMADNIEVSPDQVTGLGLVIEGTKQVVLQTTSQIFQIPKAGGVSPTNITLTAYVKNIVAVPTLTIAPGGGTMSIPVTLTDGVFTFTEAQMTTDTVTFLLSASEGGNDYQDTMTIVKAREGIDSLNGLLTNESHTLPADYLGNVTNYGGSTGRFKVFQGINDVTTACTFSLVSGGNPDNLTYSLTASGASAGTYSVTGGYPTGTEVTTLTFRATFGTKTIDKVFTLSKAKAGVDGATARAVRLNPTSQAFTFDGADNAAPPTQTITFTAVGQNLAGSPTITATAYNAAGTSLGEITLGGSGSARTMTNAQFLAPGATVRAVVSVTWDGLTDQVTVVKLKDGASNVVGYLTNEATVVATANDGTGGNYSGAGGTFKVFNGLTDVTGTAVTYSIPTSSGVVISIATSGVYSVTATTADTGTATLRAVYNGVTIEKTYTIARSKAGTNGTSGSDATAYWLARSAAAIQKSVSGVYTPSSITFSAYSATGSEAPTAYAGRFVIATTADGTNYTNQYTSAANESTKNYTIPANIKAVRVRLYQAGGIVNLMDEEIVPVVVDGATGADGNNGADGLAMVLSNEAHVFPASNTGVVSSYVGSGTTIRVYAGANLVTYDGTGTANNTWTVSSVATNITRGAITDSGAFATVADHSGVAAGTDTSSITYTVTGKNPQGTSFTLVKSQTFSKSKAGTNGSNGTDGVDGERGSRTFYVALAGTGNTWSDSIATTAASVDGGPILNDIVTEYNNSQNFSQTRFWNGTSWLIINAVIDGNLVVDGTIATDALQAGSVTAVKIDSRGLSLKDASGGIIFDANTVVGTDSASVLGFNPRWSAWSGTLPVGWALWAGNNPVKNSSDVIGGPYSVRWTTVASESQGMYNDADFVTEPIPAGSYVQGVVTIKIVTNVAGGGKSGYLVRLYTNAAKTTYVDTKVEIPDATATGVWQRIPFIAGASGLAIYSIRIYQMASWGSFTGGNASGGKVIAFGPIAFEIRNPITAVTAGVWMDDAAINLAQINTASITNLSALSATIGTLRTATSGGRVEIQDNKIRVYDTTNALRVSIGYLL